MCTALIFLPLCFRVEVDMLKHKRPKVCHRFFHLRRHPDLRPVHAVRYYVVDQPVQPLFTGISQYSPYICGDIILGKYSAPDRVVHIMVDVGKLI